MLAFITREQLDHIRANDPEFNYDVALPQPTYDLITKITGRNPFGHIYMIYPKGSIWGTLGAVTQEGAQLLQAYLEKRPINI